MFRLFILLALCSFICNADTQPKTMVISTINHPATEVYKHIITNAYLDIGFKVRFVSLPGSRRFHTLNDGITDADLGARISVRDKYKNILRVPPALATGVLYLYCAMEPCDRKTIEDKDTSFYIDRGDYVTLTQDLKTRISAKVFFIERDKIISQLFNMGRIDYFFNISIEDKFGSKLNRKYFKYSFGETSFYHHINKKHFAIADQLSVAIQKQLEEFYQKQDDKDPGLIVQ